MIFVGTPENFFPNWARLTLREETFTFYELLLAFSVQAGDVGGWRRVVALGSDVMLVVSASKVYRSCPPWWRVCSPWLRVACLVHTDGIDELRTAHQGHRHTSSSSATHFTLDLYCLVAILPGMVRLVWLCLGALYLSDLLSKPLVPAFPPFIPPKALARA